jgi:hypothetical protein
MKTRAAQTLALVGLAVTLGGCGLFGVKGPGLGPVVQSPLAPDCQSPPYELPAHCPLVGLGATPVIFDAAHLYVGSTVVIPGTTNYLQVRTTNGHVSGFLEQFHASPPFDEHEAGFVSRAELPGDAKKLFAKTIGGRCQVLEYRSATLSRRLGTRESAGKIVLRSPNADAFDPNNIATATLELTTPHSGSTVTTC